MKNQFLKRNLLSLSGLAVFTILAVGSVDPNEMAKKQQVQQTTSSIPASTPVGTNEVAIEIASTKLAKEYEDNEIAADQKYKGRVLQVTGTISNIGKDILNNMYVELKGVSFWPNVQCFLDSEHESKAAQMRKGQKLTVKGVCEGKMGNVLLQGCMPIQ